MSVFATTISRVLGWRTAAAFVLYTVPIIVLVNLAEEVRERETLPFDEATLKTINNHASPTLDTLMVCVTQLGSALAVIVMMVGIVSLLVKRRLYRSAAILLAGVGGAAALNLILKALFQRDRPQLWDRIVTENSYSFPSGHAMASSAFYFSLVVIAWPTRWRWWVIIGGALYTVLIGFSRLYLGVHYPTDVVAGWLVSFLWVGLVYVVSRPSVTEVFRK